MTRLTASQRQQALLAVYALEDLLGVPEAVYVSEHGVTILANQVTALRWSGRKTIDAGGHDVPLFVSAVTPLRVTA